MASQRPEEEQEERGFTISDKRLFTKDGSKRPTEHATSVPPRASTPPPPPPPPPSSPPPSQASATEASAPPPSGGEMPPRDLPPADFSTFVSMLAHNVMLFLGQMPDPMTQQRHRDLAQAKHTIDMLIMLREKTRGNLSPEEDRLLQELLPQLQVAFVNARKQVG